MKKPWSLSTTVRNPDRVLPFLRVLKEMEGENFDEAGQVKFQTLLIQNRLYQPTGLSVQLASYYGTAEDTMSFAKAREIFNHMVSRSKELRNDLGLRGRTSVAPLTKMGLATAKKTTGAIVITDLGNAFLKGKVDIGDVYFRFFIKWQIPNPVSNDYAGDGTYNIKPFIGTLHLINQVNLKEIKRGKNPKGLSNEEFALFSPTLVHSKDIESYSNQILQLRDAMDGKTKADQKQILKSYKREFAIRFLDSGDNSEIEKLLNNLKDYGDNAIRYFRLTRYIYIRGNGFYVDLEPRRSVEINNLLTYDNAEAIEFASKDEYFEYLSDISKPQLPWETKDKFIEIIKKLTEEIAEYEKKLNSSAQHRLDYQKLSKDALKDYANLLRSYRRDLQEQEVHQVAQDAGSVKEYIEALENIFSQEDRPIALEKYASLGLNALNDALSIKPNYPVGDDNEPTFTAPANVPDIECYYESSNAICEVTMLTGRDQWYNEGQPVMRHLRDFEDANHTKTTYCIFLAPRLHRDTVNTFWMAVKYEYEGKPQKIVPLSITQFADLLKVLPEIKKKGVFLTHQKLFELYEKIVTSSSNFENPADWLQEIPNIINFWKSEVTA
ncbi:hypothetical protein A3K24_02400 [candidate division Kazan bacterium RIFCSPHIGHO2_01_FULL_44_14]|uniref:Restriction endonuclease n=1 Tax=candidate division Kazan bacterium RIFCSPLOWO2_01_FULL_45_19 TaxID=1798538 RepID=A0A1F4NQW0_UNCK3|nr:hypothetical protein [uncultured bacterium]AQS31091.1 hypothetical protein [uncultured bacterium]OGB73667.1 MAG: hypothetical protein A3K51_02400 [candidate division Kazan bacterium RIFCSPLOWO2_01_FULL_45_19]OGB77912.1 MAG: hypothetical protein A3K24_02400 [candidate division Kazan bacterium RIFCSPHIGHO2_01_FULL_44_14]